MAEPGGPTPATPPGPPTPAEGRLWAIAQRALVRGWPGVKRYLRQVWGSFLTLAVLAYVAQLYAAGTLHRWNDRFLEGVSQLRPWRLAQVFYGALFAGGLFDLCQVCRRVVIYLFPLNMPYALYHTGRSLLAEGAVGLGTAVVAYLLGLLVVVVREQRKIPEAAEWEAVWVKVLVFSPP